MKDELDQIWEAATERRKGAKNATVNSNFYKKKSTKSTKISRDNIRFRLKNGKKVAKRVRKELAKMFK